MAFARVVSFNEVTDDRMVELKRRIGEGERPDDVPATEVMLLHDAGAGQALVILFFDTEDDYACGDAALNAMPSDDTPGARAVVAKYEVSVRMTAD